MAKVEPKVGDKRELGGRMSADLFGQALLRVLKKQRKTVDQLLALKPEEIRALPEMKDEVNDISQELMAEKEKARKERAERLKRPKDGDSATSGGLNSESGATGTMVSHAEFSEAMARQQAQMDMLMSLVTTQQGKMPVSPAVPHID